jgi:hypothetical protein
MQSSNALKIEFDSANHDLIRHAMLLELSFSLWSVRRSAKGIANEVAQHHNADPKMFSASKKLLEENKEYKAVTAAQTAIRKAHYARTLPWGKGSDIIKMNYFSDYTAEMNTLINDFDQAVQNFVNVYPYLVSQASYALGDEFIAKQYPDASVIRNKFKVKIVPLPFVTSGDFRVEANQFEIRSIKNSFEQAYTEKLGEAIKDIFVKIAEPIKEMSEKLRLFQVVSDENGKEHRVKSFQESVVDNIKAQVNILPSLNLLNDPAIDRFIAEVSQELCRYNAETLKSDEVLRAATADKADEILDKISAYL